MSCKKILLPMFLALSVSNCMPVCAQASGTFTVAYGAHVTLDPKRMNRGDFSDGMISALSGMVGNSIPVGDVTDTVSFSKDSYRIQSSGVVGRMLGSFMSKGTFVRTSDGLIVDGSIATIRYVDIRASNPPLTTLVDLKTNHIYFYSGKSVTSTVTSKGRIKDLLSLGYSFIGNLPSGAVTTSLSDGKSIKNATFDVKKDETQLNASLVPCVKLTRRIVSPDDASVEYWLRATDGLPLRVRIGMSQRYGAVLDLKATRVPEKVAR